MCYQAGVIELTALEAPSGRTGTNTLLLSVTILV